MNTSRQPLALKKLIDTVKKLFSFPGKEKTPALIPVLVNKNRNR
jgi:hypothetical protein